MVLQGILIGIVVAIAFHIGLHSSPMMACSMAFLTLTMSRLLHGFNCRDQKSIFALGFKRNMFSLYAFLIGLVLVLLIIFTPVGRSMFRVAAMNGTQVTTIFLLAIIPTAIIQLRKIISKHN